MLVLAELTEVGKQYGSFSLDCTMRLEEGRITGLIGKNGAGKSTTFKAILGLIHVDGGTVLGYGVSFLLLAAGTVIAAVSSIFRNSGLEKGDLMLSFETGVMVVAVIMIFLVPVQLKFGAENGRIIMAAVFMGLFGVFYFVVKVAESLGVDMDQVMVDIQSLGIPVIAGVILVFLGIASFISCLISIRIMERKEF